MPTRGLRRLALCLTLAVTVGCTAAPPGRDGSALGEAPARWRTGMDSSVTGIAAARGAVFVLTAGGFRYPPQVYRLDARTGGIDAHRTVPGQPSGVTAGRGRWLWVVGTRHPDQYDGTGVQVLATGSLLRRHGRSLRHPPQSVAMVDGVPWVGSAGRLYRLDARSARPEEALPLKGTAYQVLPVPGRHLLVSVGGRRVQVVDSGSGRVLAHRSLAAAGHLTGAVIEDDLWLAVPDDDGGVRLRRLALPGLEPSGRGPRLDQAGARLAAAGRVLWVSDPGRDRVLCLDPRTGEVRGSRTVEGAGAVHAAGGALYVGGPTSVSRVPASCPSTA